MVLTGLTAGPIGDRFERRTVILISDLVAMIATFCSALLVNHVSQLSWAVVISFSLRAVIVFCFALRAPSMAAEISTSVGPERLRSAISFSSSSRYIVGFVGEASGGTIYAAFGKMIVFLVDSFSYLIACLFTFSLPPSKAHNLNQSHSQDEGKKKSVLRVLIQDLKDGVRFVAGEPAVRPLFIILFFLNIVFSPIVVSIPFVVRSSLGGGVNNVGYSLAAMSSGMLLGSMISGLRVFEGRLHLLFVSALLAMSVGLMSVLASSSPAVLLGPIFMVGTGAGIVNIVVPAHIQSLTPQSFQSRVVSLIMFSGQVFNPVAQGVFGGIGELLGRKINLIPFFFGSTCLGAFCNVGRNDPHPKCV